MKKLVEYQQLLGFINYFRNYVPKFTEKLSISEMDYLPNLPNELWKCKMNSTFLLTIKSNINYN